MIDATFEKQGEWCWNGRQWQPVIQPVYPWARLEEYQRRLFALIRSELESPDGSHHKSYEGALTLHLPNYFQAQQGDGAGKAYAGDHFMLEMHCYMLGPQRHYEYQGATLDEVLDKAMSDLALWEAERDGARV